MNIDLGHLPQRPWRRYKLDEQVASELFLLYPREYDEMAHVEADLIFVAGLGGHYLETWKAKDETIWPQHLIHKNIEAIRVWSFHYNTTLRGSSSLEKINDHARELLGKIRLKRPEESDMTAQLRPIVFVGHSLGGMLIKKAIHIARTEPSYSALWHATRGAMFFAVPHHGLDISAWRKFTTLVLRINPIVPNIKPTKRMEEEAVANSDALLAITDEFRPLQEFLFFVNYTEGKLMRGLATLLVDEGRGWMDAPRKVELKLPDGDHLGICQFGRNQHDQMNFELVISHLKDLIGASKALEQIGDEALAALESLCPKGFHGYFMAKQATMGTCGWIAEREAFQNWIGDGKENQMLWIQGPPASGKSFLARHIITDLIPPSTQKIAHCFLDDSVLGRGSLEDLLRATLHHAIRVEPELIQQYLVSPYLKATQHLVVRMPDDEIWRRDVIVPLWPEVVARVTTRSSVTMVVDGFDEMSLECRQGFLDCLDAFEHKVESQEQRERLRILLVSREDPEADEQLNGRDKFQVYRLTPEDIKEDMEKTVMAALTDTAHWDERLLEFRPDLDVLEVLDQEQLEDMCEAIVSGSDGNFLLAKMTAEEVVQPLVSEPSVPARQILEELPTDPEGIYDRILKRMQQDESYLPFARHVLRWAAFQKEPLKEAELDTAIALGMAQDRKTDRRISKEDLETLQNLLGSVRPMVEKHCRRAVEIQEGHLQPIHEILKERLAAESADDLQLEEGPSHATLGSLCASYLTMSYFEDSHLPVAESVEEKVKLRIEQRPFSRYAALHWQDHVQAAGMSWLGAEDHVTHAQALLENKGTEYAISCSEIQWFLSWGTMRGYCPGGVGVSAGLVTRTPSPTSDIRSPSVVDSTTEPSEVSVHGEEGSLKYEVCQHSGSETQSTNNMPAVTLGGIKTFEKAETEADQTSAADSFSNLASAAASHTDATGTPKGSPPPDSQFPVRTGGLEVQKEVVGERQDFNSDSGNRRGRGSGVWLDLQKDLRDVLGKEQIDRPDPQPNHEGLEPHPSKREKTHREGDAASKNAVDIALQEQEQKHHTYTSAFVPQDSARGPGSETSLGQPREPQDIPIELQVDPTPSNLKNISSPKDTNIKPYADLDRVRASPKQPSDEEAPSNDGPVRERTEPPRLKDQVQPKTAPARPPSPQTQSQSTKQPQKPSKDHSLEPPLPGPESPSLEDTPPTEDLRTRAKELDAAQTAIEYLFPDRVLAPRGARLGPEQSPNSRDRDNQDTAVTEPVTRPRIDANDRPGGTTWTIETGLGSVENLNTDGSHKNIDDPQPTPGTAREPLGHNRYRTASMGGAPTPPIEPPTIEDWAVDRSEIEEEYEDDRAGGETADRKKKSGLFRRIIKGTKKVGKKIVKGVRGK